MYIYICLDITFVFTGHGKTAASASIPSRYQTVVTDNSERKGFLSRAKRFGDVNVVCVYTVYVQSKQNNFAYASESICFSGHPIRGSFGLNPKPQSLKIITFQFCSFLKERFFNVKNRFCTLLKILLWYILFLFKIDPKKVHVHHIASCMPVFLKSKKYQNRHVHAGLHMIACSAKEFFIRFCHSFQNNKSNKVS